MQNSSSKSKTVLVQNWVESERGWKPRPDGFSIHVDSSMLREYCKEYDKRYNSLPPILDAYSRIEGEPVEVEVSDEFFDKIVVACGENNGVWGEGYSFSITPMCVLKDSDIRWPK